MVERNYFRMSSDEEVSQYKFEFCKNCPFYECELIEEYEMFSKNHHYPMEHEGDEEVRLGDNSTGETVICYMEGKDADFYDKNRNKLKEHTAVVDNFGRKISLSYNKREFEDGCIMGCRHVCQIECGRKTVTEGIGDHYKIELDYYGRIRKNIKNKWEPLQPVFISAQTGQGKNYFIENTLIPYVRELNIKNQTKQKVLILSNRLALQKQIKNRLNESDDLDENKKIYPYSEYADVMTYQSLLLHEKTLKEKQKYEESRYIYVICDEAHFFTSDAMFNPHTHKILQMIVRLFQEAVRVYMSATPYECLEYIIKCEDEERKRLNLKKYAQDQSKWKYGKMIFYHFKRDYSYLDVKIYSSISELYGEIVEGVVRKKEKWLIFIDDKEKCVREKNKLEKLIRDKESSLVIEEKKSKKKDEGGAGTDKDNEAEKNVEKVYAVDANSKKEPIYQDIVKNERLNKDTYVLISTSVLDNGINLKGIKNIVVSNMEKSKCLQMVGRARKSKGDEYRTLYVKRFYADEVDKRIKNLMKQQDAYHSYELVYDGNGNIRKEKDCSGYQFFNKYYNGKESDWRDAKHWFGTPFIEAITNLYLNEIAKSLVERLIPQYQYILDEMKEEEAKKDEQRQDQEKGQIGQKYLEYQLSWFRKKYCEDDDITFVDKEKAKKKFIDFLGSYAESAEQIMDKGSFRQMFTKLYDAAFGRMERDKWRIYGIDLANKGLKAKNIKFKVVGCSKYWVVKGHNWEIDNER